MYFTIPETSFAYLLQHDKDIWYLKLHITFNLDIYTYQTYNFLSYIDNAQNLALHSTISYSLSLSQSYHSLGLGIFFARRFSCIFCLLNTCLTLTLTLTLTLLKFLSSPLKTGYCLQRNFSSTYQEFHCKICLGYPLAP